MNSLLPSERHCRRIGFTLVELLVVIGVLGILMGILVPVISKSRDSATTVQCQIQLKQLSNGLAGYAAENKGSLPYGQFRIDPADARNYVTWQTTLNHYFNSRNGTALKRTSPNSGEVLIGEGSGNPFLCPAAIIGSQARSSYACNMVAMPDRDFEVANTYTKKQPLLQPANVTRLFPHNILLFDTGVVVNSDAMYVVGYDVDNQYFSDPADTLARFFRGNDPYEGNKFRGSALPIITDPSQNRDWYDAGTKSPRYPFQGNVRYRHRSNGVANFAFADGHVESLAPEQCIRYMWKLRWPPGMPASMGHWTDDD